MSGKFRSEDTFRLHPINRRHFLKAAGSAAVLPALLTRLNVIPTRNDRPESKEWKTAGMLSVLSLLMCMLAVTANAGTPGTNTTPPAQTFYVAADGNDSNPGTLSQPFATVPHCLAQRVGRGGGGGYTKLSGSPLNAPTIENNDYYNYGGSAISSEGLYSDSNPVKQNPQLSACYAIASDSPVLFPPVYFRRLPIHWGPPGYVIPNSGSTPSYLASCVYWDLGQHKGSYE
jgi:hypothetical protein